MANINQLTLLRNNQERWNLWREKHPIETIDLSEADLSGVDLYRINLSDADLHRADLSGANLSFVDLSDADLSGAHLQQVNLSHADLTNVNLSEADLSDADLREAHLDFADLSGANFSGAHLQGASLHRANLNSANFSGANLSSANLHRASLIETGFTGAILIDCTIYGIATWDVQLENAVQKNLVITQPDGAIVATDNLKVAQFISLVLNNKEIRDVITTLATKAVLILGHFTRERKALLEALRDALRAHNYLPILFDFVKPDNFDFTETIITLAHLSCFIILDFTEVNIPYEVASTVTGCQVPIQPIIEGTEMPYRGFEDFKTLPWILNLYHYQNMETSVASLKKHIIEPAEHKAEELKRLKISK